MPVATNAYAASKPRRGLAAWPPSSDAPRQQRSRRGSRHDGACPRRAMLLASNDPAGGRRHNGAGGRPYDQGRVTSDATTSGVPVGQEKKRDPAVGSDRIPDVQWRPSFFDCRASGPNARCRLGKGGVRVAVFYRTNGIGDPFRNEHQFPIARRHSYNRSFFPRRHSLRNAPKCATARHGRRQVGAISKNCTRKAHAAIAGVLGRSPAC